MYSQRATSVGLIAAAMTACAAPVPASTRSDTRASTHGNSIVLEDGWRIRSSACVEQTGAVVSTCAYRPDGWYPTTVPATVLNAFVKNGVYPDPRVGLNNFRIPDACDAFNEKHDLAKYSHLPGRANPWKAPYWYRMEFHLPRSCAGKRVWLNFDGINYRADVWLNGHCIADRQQIVGSFSRYRLDVTQHARIGQVNCLAVKVHLVDHPGVPEAQLDVFGKVRNFRKEIMKDVTLVMSIGYDCMPTVRDRLTGLWQGVTVDWTGPVDLRDPRVVTRLPLPQTSPARLTVSADLVNATASPQKGVLVGRIVETGATFSTPVELAPSQTSRVLLSPEKHAALVMADPRLWWPRNYGSQDLYHLSLRLEIDGCVSDEQTVTFGIRQITKTLHELDGAHGLRLHVNGKKVFCRGGYIQPEILYDWDAARMDIEVRYLTHANMNLVYFEDVPNPPDAFLDACDRHGLMIGQCFYGCYWMQPGTDYPQDLELLSRGTVDIIKRYWNHPSLVLYMAMNEGETRQAVYEMWRKHILALDPTRIFIPSGSFPDYRKKVPEWIKPDLPVGMNDYPPKSYGWQTPETYYTWVREKRNWMFMMESGSASLPPVSSLARFIPDLGRSPKGAPYPLNVTWAHHGANSYYKPYDAAVRRLYGSPESVADYCWKGHLATADQHRAMFEAANHRMWDVTSGFTEWKVNACWPSVQWQVYDWYLKPMVSFYAIRRACEPLHVQLCPLDGAVVVINNRLEPQADLQVRARVYDFGMTLRWEKRASASVPANAYKEVFAVPATLNVGPIRFVKLELKTPAGDLASDNFYWLPSKPDGDLTALAALPPVTLNASCDIENRGSEKVATVRIENPTNRLALFAQVALTKGRGGEEILPVFWEDNYLSLLAKETKTVRATFSGGNLDGKTPTLEVGGWNVRSAFDCAALTVSKQTAKPKESVTVTAEIADTFIDGSRVWLFVNGRAVDSRLIWARHGERRKVDFALALDKPGTHEIRVGNQTASIAVTADAAR